MMRMMWVGEGNSSNDLRSVEVMHNEFVDVVPTFWCCMEYVWCKVDIFSYNLCIAYDVSCIMGLYSWGVTP